MQINKISRKNGDTDKTKIPDVIGLEDTTIRNKKIDEIESKIQDVSALVTATVLDTKTAMVEIKIPDVSGLVKKTDYKLKYQTLRQYILLLLIIINV